MLEEALARAVGFLERGGIGYMVIGGFALPAYGLLRATADIDVAVDIRTETAFKQFVAAGVKSGFESGTASFANPVNVLRDGRSGLEVEFWLRPEGVVWDSELRKRLRRVHIGKTMVRLIPPEDFVVSKLARPNRGLQDEMDVKSMLVRLGNRIDKGYLQGRAKAAGVEALLEAIARG